MLTSISYAVPLFKYGGPSRVRTEGIRIKSPAQLPTVLTVQTFKHTTTEFA